MLECVGFVRVELKYWVLCDCSQHACLPRKEEIVMNSWSFVFRENRVYIAASHRDVVILMLCRDPALHQPCKQLEQSWVRARIRNPSTTQAQPRHNPGTTQAQPRHNPGITQAQPRHNPGTTLPSHPPGLNARTQITNVLHIASVDMLCRTAGCSHQEGSVRTAIKWQPGL